MFLPANHEARGYGGLLAGSMAAMVSTDGDRFSAKRVFSLPGYVYSTAVLAGYLLVVMYDGARIHVVLTLAAAPFIAVLVRSQGALAKSLGSKAFAFVGRRTYGIYLIHLLIANGVITILVRIHVATHWFLIFVLTFCLSLAIASVLKVTIEDPLIARGKRWAGRLSLATDNLPGRAHNLET
jgi:peptidoglycan/LPS O-acetylase OafA/YrhL